MDYRLHFTCGGILYFLKRYKHTAQRVKIVRMSAHCVCTLPQNQQTRHACTPSWPQRCSGNILIRNLLSGYPTYFLFLECDQDAVPKLISLENSVSTGYWLSSVGQCTKKKFHLWEQHR